MGDGFDGNIVPQLADQRTSKRIHFSIVNDKLDIVKTFSLRKGYYRNIAEIVDGLNETIRVSKELKEILGREETTLLAYFEYH